MRHVYLLAVGAVISGGLVFQAWAGPACCGAKEKGACGIVKPEVKADSATNAVGYGVVDTAALRSILDAKTPVAVVDARTAQYDDGKRISGAISLPADSSTEAIEKALPDKNQLVVTYCSNLKCPASKILSEKLIEMGYKNVLKYPDGLEGWLQAGQPAAEASKPM